MSGADPQSMRASTVDRDACANILNQAMAEGRLTADEHDERLTRCYSAVTMGDLAALTADLPQPTGGVGSPPTAAPAPTAANVPATSPSAVQQTNDSGGGIRSKRGLRAMWASWAGVSVLMIVIWLLTGLSSDSGLGGISGFWPMWVIGPWGAVNLMATLGVWGNKDQ